MRSTLLILLSSSVCLISATEIDRDNVLDIKPEVPVAVDMAGCVYDAISKSNIDCDVNAMLECVAEETEKDTLDRIQQCLLSSGCISKESFDKSYIWADTCRPPSEVEEEEYPGKELKRREDSSTSETKKDSTSETTTTEDTTSKTSTSETTAASTTSDTTTTSETTSTTASAAASTTVASSTTSDSSSTTTTGSTLSTSTSSSTSSSSTSSSSTNSCFDYTYSSTTACWYNSASSTSSKTCTLATATASSCASGMYCTTDTAGADVCMLEENSLTASGTVVAVFFGTAIATCLITILTCACKDSRAAARKQKAYEASLEADAKVSSVVIDIEAAKRRSSRALSMGAGSPRSPSGGAGPNRSRSPLSGIPLMPVQRYNAVDGNDESRDLLENSRQGSPNTMERSLTGGSHSGSSSPSRNEASQYHEVRH